MIVKIFGKETGPGDVSLERDGKNILMKIRHVGEETHLTLSMKTFKKMIAEVTQPNKKGPPLRRAR